MSRDQFTILRIDRTGSLTDAVPDLQAGGRWLEPRSGLTFFFPEPFDTNRTPNVNKHITQMLYRTE